MLSQFSCCGQIKLDSSELVSWILQCVQPTSRNISRIKARISPSKIIRVMSANIFFLNIQPGWVQYPHPVQLLRIRPCSARGNEGCEIYCRHTKCCSHQCPLGGFFFLLAASFISSLLNLSLRTVLTKCRALSVVKPLLCVL